MGVMDWYIGVGAHTPSGTAHQPAGSVQCNRHAGPGRVAEGALQRAHAQLNSRVSIDMHFLQHKGCIRQASSPVAHAPVARRAHAGMRSTHQPSGCLSRTFRRLLWGMAPAAASRQARGDGAIQAGHTLWAQPHCCRPSVQQQARPTHTARPSTALTEPPGTHHRQPAADSSTIHVHPPSGSLTVQVPKSSRSMRAPCQLLKSPMSSASTAPGAHSRYTVLPCR
jgi:hypothetical protein